MQKQFSSYANDRSQEEINRATFRQAADNSNWLPREHAKRRDKVGVREGS